MDSKEVLYGRRLLIVDDEPDVLETLIELLEMCKIDTATTFEEGKRLLETGDYECAVLDIMGVDGFKLLDIATERGIPALMLTAHALTEESLKESAERGASYFAPKDLMHEVPQFLADVVEAKEKKKNPWVKWFERLGKFYDRRFVGTNWREKEKEFWDRKLNYY
jgi:DNA-binding NtrC family response regulator